MTSPNGIKTTKVGFLIENQFEDSEYIVPYTALKQAGAEVILIGSRMNDEYQGKRGKIALKPNATATEVRAEDFDAIVILGGMAPDRIRTNDNAVRLVIDAIASGKIVAAICHGPQVLIETDQLRGKQVTGFRSIRKDLQNAGAIYINEPVVVDNDNLITARQSGDLPIFATVILTRLKLSGEENTVLPEIDDRNYEWWRLGEAWGGSTRNEIINALNTANMGEHYTIKAFEGYATRTSDPEINLVLQEVCTTKKRHIQMLEARLTNFGQQVSWQSIGSEAFATFQTWLQTSDDIGILRKALGDLQTGIVDAFNLSIQLTDPVSVNLLMEIESNLKLHEQTLCELYRARLGSNVQPPMPTTIAAVS
jgi:protease I